MTRPNLLLLVPVWLSLLSVGVSSPKGQPAAPFASTTKIRASESPAARLPAASPAPVPAPHSPHPPQPDDSYSVGVFPNPVTCETLVQYALANNREIQAARYHARALGARVPQAASLADPTLMATVFLDSLQTAAGAQDVVMSLSQRFPWFGKRGLRSQVAYHDAMAAYARLTAAELQVIEEVKRAYFDLYFLQSAIAETRRLEPRLRDVVEIAQTKFRTNTPGAGLESVWQTQIELSKLKTDLVELESAKARAQARLAGILDLPPQTRFTATPQLDQTAITHTAELLVELAETCQPELEARRREVWRDRSATALASRNYWPDVNFSLNWYEIDSQGLSPVANGHDAFSLGVGVNLPVYRTRLDAAVREARYRAASTTRRYAAARDRLLAEVQTLYAQFVEHDQTLAILDSEILPRAARTLDLAIEAYRDRGLQFQQLIDTYRTLLNYRIDFHKRVAMREQAIASLERAVGCAITSAEAETPDPLGHLPAPPLPR